MKRALTCMAILLTALVVAAPAEAGPIWFMKLENQGRYIQVAAHGPIDVTATHNQGAPNQYWNTPVRFNETAGAAGDSLQIAGTSQHIVPVCTGEVPKGGVFPYGFGFSNPPLGVTQQVAAGQTLHPGPPNHKDMFISAAAVGSVNPGQIQNYVYLSIGRHDPPGCQAAGGTLQPETPGPGPDPVYGSTALIYDEADDSIAMGVAVAAPGVTLNNVQEAYIGSKSTGLPILDLLGVGDWYTADTPAGDVLGVAGFIDVVFPQQYLPELFAGETFVAIVSPALPGGRISGDLGLVDAPLIPEPSSIVLAGLGLVGLVLIVVRRRRG